MALVGIQQPQARSKVVGQHEGGGKTGTAIGMAAGGAIGGILGSAGGPLGAAGGAITGAAGGAALGNTIGNLVAPPSAGHEAISRRVDSMQPQFYHSDRSEALRQSLMALSQQPQEIRSQYERPLTQAYVMSLANDNAGHPLPNQDYQYNPGVA